MKRDHLACPSSCRILITAIAVLVLTCDAIAAENLRLAAGLSFTNDSSSRFPIEGDRLGDGEVGRERPALVFFGTAHCFNTNREAERVVALFPKYRDRVSFVIVDLDRATPEQKPLIEKYYRGAIPGLAVLDAKGVPVYNRSGETARERRDTASLEGLLQKALGAS